MSRIIIFTGKGGVGKTSVAAAHALRSAREGKRTLLVSADMAHNLGDVFEVETGGRQTRIEDNLTILELDPGRIMREEFPDLNRAIVEMISTKGKLAGDVSSQFMIPGFENLFSLLKIRNLYDEGRFDRIFVDCAPSGETLSLLKLPELLTWYMEKFFPVGRAMTRVLSPVAKRRYKVKLPDSEAMDQVALMHRKLVELQELLKDPAVSSVRLVGLPEKMVNEETKRDYMYLNLYGYHVDRVFINRVLAPQPDNPFMENWREIQAQYIREMESVFMNVPITEIPWYPEEIRGIAAVERLCDALPPNETLFGAGTDAADIEGGRTLWGAETYDVTEDGYCLKLGVPGVGKVTVLREDEETCAGEAAVLRGDDLTCAGEAAAESGSGGETVLTVRKNGLDLDIKADNVLRRIPLPGTLQAAAIKGAYIEDGELRILFSNQ